MARRIPLLHRRDEFNVDDENTPNAFDPNNPYVSLPHAECPQVSSMNAETPGNREVTATDINISSLVYPFEQEPMPLVEYVPPAEEKRRPPGAGAVDRMLMAFEELSLREEQKKLQSRPERDFHGLKIDHEFPLIKENGVPDAWLKCEPCQMDLTKCKIKDPPLVCEYGIRIEWHYEEMMQPQKQVAFAVARAISRGQHATLESPTGTGKTAALLCSALAAQRFISIKTGACPQILYGTRTQGQVKQVVRELRDCPFRPSVTCLGSRDKGLCINKSVMDMAHSQRTALRTVCKEARKNFSKLQPEDRRDPSKPYCDKVAGLEPPFPQNVFPLLRPMYGDSAPAMENHIVDLEDLASVAAQHNGCPYFLSQVNAMSAQIVICPYNYILDPLTAKRSRVQYRSRIIILDEAHNIEQVCRDAGSSEISLKTLYGDESALQALQAHAQQLMSSTMEITPLHSSTAEFYNTNTVLRQVETFFGKIRDKMRAWTTAYTSEHDLVEEAAAKNFDKRHRWEVHSWSLHKGTLGYFASQFGWKTQASIPHECEITDPRMVVLACESLTKHLSNQPSLDAAEIFVLTVRRALDDLLAIAQALSQMWENMDSYGVTFCVSLGRVPGEGVQSMINLFLLAPKVIFEEIAKSAQCIILASGTLSPINSFFTELGPTFGKNQIPGRFAGAILSPLQANHVIEPQQLFLQRISTVNCCGIERRFCSKMKDMQTGSRWNEDLLCGLGRSLVQLVEVIPEGVLVFLPSYRMLGKVEALWQSRTSRQGGYKNTVWEALQRAKGTIIVEESAKEISDLQDEYIGAIRSTNTCLLLGVLRAKCSEGISFNDENSRAVIVVGISYPEIMSPEVRLKKEFNDFLVRSNESPLSGSAWYQQQAFRAINQALGRCIRHRHDYGALFVLDARWSEGKAEDHLALWMKQHEFRAAAPVEHVLPHLKEHFRLLRSKRSFSTLEPCICASSIIGRSVCPQHRNR